MNLIKYSIALHFLEDINSAIYHLEGNFRCISRITGADYHSVACSFLFLIQNVHHSYREIGT